MEKFIKRLTELLEKNNMSQRELAIKIEVQEATISRYIHGDRRPTSVILSRIADALNTTSDYLLGKTDNPNKIIQVKEPSIDYIKVAKKAENYGIPAKSLEEFIELVKKSVVKE